MPPFPLGCPWPPLLHVATSCISSHWKSLRVASLNLLDIEKPTWALLWSELVMSSCSSLVSAGPGALEIKPYSGPARSSPSGLRAGGAHLLRSAWGRAGEDQRSPGLWWLSRVLLGLASLPPAQSPSGRAISPSLNTERTQQAPEASGHPQRVTGPRQPVPARPRPPANSMPGTCPGCSALRASPTLPFHMGTERQGIQGHDQSIIRRAQSRTHTI